MCDKVGRGTKDEHAGNTHREAQTEYEWVEGQIDSLKQKESNCVDQWRWADGFRSRGGQGLLYAYIQCEPSLAKGQAMIALTNSSLCNPVNPPNLALSQGRLPILHQVIG